MQTPPLSLPRLSWQMPRLSWQSGSLAVALLLVLTTCAPTGGDGDDSLRFTPTALDAPSEQAPFAAADLDATPTGGALGSLDAGESQSPVGGAGAVEEPAPEEPAPQQVLTPAPLPDEVDLHEPDLLVRAADEQLPVDPAEVEGAAYATGVGELIARAEDASGAEHELELLAVDPIAFRPLTPDVTAQSRAVWERLDDGDILVRHDVAHELGLELGEHMELRTDAGDVTVRIGALAANGAPPFADIIVPFEVAAQLGSPGVNALVVSAQQEAETLVEALEPLGDVELRRPPEPEQSTSRPTNGSVELEPFTYTSRGDGTIAIHGDWVQRNIVNVDIPRMGTTRCHRAMVPQLYAALQEIIDEGLYDHFKPEQFGGCWVPRHIMWNPNRGLSMHSWGLAIDFNVQDNWYGAEPQMDPRIVAIFKKWGFAWGGDWSTPDGMHFEVERFVQVE
jgi:hypothetical protein